MGCHFLLQGIFSTQGLNLNLLWLLHCRQLLYPLSHRGSPHKGLKLPKKCSYHWLRHCVPSSDLVCCHPSVLGTSPADPILNSWSLTSVEDLVPLVTAQHSSPQEADSTSTLFSSPYLTPAVYLSTSCMVEHHSYSGWPPPSSLIGGQNSVSFGLMEECSCTGAEQTSDTSQEWSLLTLLSPPELPLQVSRGHTGPEQDRATKTK